METRGKKHEAAGTDPMPARIEPCLALLVSKPTVGPIWAFEIKWDGYRLAIHVEPGGVRVLTRGGHDWTTRFAHIAEAASKLGPGSMILDGEAVVLDEQGRSDFGGLQQALGGRGGKRFAREAIFYAFDLLYLDGRDLTREPLSERRRLLDPMLNQDGLIRLSEEIEGDGSALLKHACKLGLEGIIGKRLDKPYRSGRNGDWIKAKCVQSDSFAIVGYEPSVAMRGMIGRLLLAARRGGELVYVGGVGTGFTHQELTDLKKRLDALRATTPPVKLKRKRAVFVDPVLIAEIEFRAWTDDDKLRHASFKGLRESADHSEVMNLDGRL
ncbi:ATP-dependent DNA ligase [Starkeya sp. ORNL1]|uniref:non-homologous end-joining DNA ligase n=1 Tax=Starkeya sp. ORNL1 TaxID=2709380 RepID=UPI0014647E28|nr:non-homologous end-joining DNA ligase [Starkeya sp. ORNL1]QJP14651.1 ATP-dependent DNA ligase [Starkeya sp. ORNL1]